jgi:pimeloyl-ACP methyl ester carboxylesterase
MLEYKSIKTISGECGYTTLGVGKPLIMIVGYTGTLFHWHGKFVHELAKNYKVYMIDNRKVGVSNSNNEESMKGLAQDTVDFIDEMCLDQPYILGWSMGGVVAQELLKHYPDKIGSTVLLATVPSMLDNSPKFYDFIAKAHTMSAQEYREGIYYYFFSHKQHENIKDDLSNSALKFSNYTYRFHALARNFQHELIQNWTGSGAEDLAKINIPTLIIWARNDLVVPQKSAMFFANHLSLPKLVIYPSGGHFLLQENYVQIANDVINFINYYNMLE